MMMSPLPAAFVGLRAWHTALRGYSFHGSQARLLDTLAALKDAHLDPNEPGNLDGDRRWINATLIE